LSYDGQFLMPVKLIYHLLRDLLPWHPPSTQNITHYNV